MAADVKIDSLDLLQQYQGHFRNFADCVEAGVLAYRGKLKNQQEAAQRKKQEVEKRAAHALDKIDWRISQLDDILSRYTFGPEDATRIKLEKERLQSRRNALIGRIESIKEKLDRSIGILEDIANLSYSYGNKTREMADAANGSLTNIIGTISNYKAK